MAGYSPVRVHLVVVKTCSAMANTSVLAYLTAAQYAHQSLSLVDVQSGQYKHLGIQDMG